MKKQIIVVAVVLIAAAGAAWYLLRHRLQAYYPPSDLPDPGEWAEKGPDSNPAIADTVSGWWGGYGAAVRHIGTVLGQVKNEDDGAAWYDKSHRTILGYLKGYDIHPTITNVNRLTTHIAAYLQAGGYHDPTAIKPGQFRFQSIHK